MDRLESMAIFVRVVERGSLSAAARSADLSVTMVGKHLRFLEDRLGVRLLERNTRSQHLTEAGRAFYERCKRLLADADEAEAIASELRLTPKGTLRIAASVTFGTEWLSAELPAFLRRNPELRVELNLTDQPVNLIEEGYDVGFYVGRTPAPGLVAQPIMPYRMVIGASPEYLRGKPPIKKPQDLLHHTCLGFSYWRHRDEWRFVGPEGPERVAVKGSLVVNNGQALRRAALGGLGVIMQPELLLARDVREKRLVQLLSGALPAPKIVHMLYVANRKQTRKLKAFTEFIRTRCEVRRRPGAIDSDE